MKLSKRFSRPKAQGMPRPPRDRDARAGSNSLQRRPDPQAEPIPDGEHKYVPRSPYRTGNW